MSSWPAPCVICGYNGEGFYQPGKHPCAASATEREALLAEVDRLRKELHRLQKVARHTVHCRQQSAYNPNCVCGVGV